MRLYRLVDVQAKCAAKFGSPAALSSDFPCLISAFSPETIYRHALATSHPLLPQAWVRSSETFYHYFSLLMAESPGSRLMNHHKFVINALSSSHQYAQQHFSRVRSY